MIVASPKLPVTVFLGSKKPPLTGKGFATIIPEVIYLFIYLFIYFLKITKSKNGIACYN